MTAASNRSASKGNTMASPLQKHRARCSWPSAREGELRLRRIDSLRFGRCAALDELLGKSPVAAAHVDPPLARSGRQPIEKDLPHELAPGAHHALVGCSIIEPNGLLGHWRRPPLPKCVVRLTLHERPESARPRRWPSFSASYGS